MYVRSLGYRTDLIFPAYDGEIVDRGEYLVIRTPTNPFFYWGNFLLFRDPPGVGDHLQWPELFAREIGEPPRVHHQTFGWDAPNGGCGEYEPFLELGFHLERSVVLTARSIHDPPHTASDVTFRPLASDDDWQQSVENQVICREPEFGEEEYRVFRRHQLARYKAMAAEGLGAWYGAFLGKRLVADLGIFHNGELGRYQSVQTHPDFRRRGIAGTLVYEAGRHALAQFLLETLVIVADQEGDPARLYESVGFRPAEFQVGLGRWG